VEIEKTLSVAAPQQQVWELLLDPQVMVGCVPGMQSIEVISPTEYVAQMHVKIAFISAKFKLRTHVVEQRAPSYLRAEGTGEDATVASSFKQQSEIFLAPGADGGTEVRLKVKVDLLGRLNAFGLNVMKTKADRMWDEFAVKLAARIDAPGAPAEAAAPSPGKAPAPGAAPALAPIPSLPAATQARTVASAPAASASWWSRLTRRRPADAVIRIDVCRGEQTVRVEWPLEGARECQDWLRELMR
jgi:carbon monoxide dehydrogenase subunit G